MAETHPVRLSAEETIRRASEFFGESGLGMALTIDETDHLRFESPNGFVELHTLPDDERQIRLRIDHQNCDEAIHQFKRILARESRVGRAALPGEHHLPKNSVF
jgi:hypothetical protein